MDESIGELGRELLELLRALQSPTLCANQNQPTGWSEPSEAILREKCFLSKEKESPSGQFLTEHVEKLKTCSGLLSDLDQLRTPNRESLHNTKPCAQLLLGKAGSSLLSPRGLKGIPLPSPYRL